MQQQQYQATALSTEVEKEEHKTKSKTKQNEELVQVHYNQSALHIQILSTAQIYWYQMILVHKPYT